jgi:hypothetical protein
MASKPIGTGEYTIKLTGPGHIFERKVGEEIAGKVMSFVMGGGTTTLEGSGDGTERNSNLSSGGNLTRSRPADEGSPGLDCSSSPTCPSDLLAAVFKQASAEGASRLTNDPGPDGARNQSGRRQRRSANVRRVSTPLWLGLGLLVDSAARKVRTDSSACGRTPIIGARVGAYEQQASYEDTDAGIRRRRR